MTHPVPGAHVRPPSARLRVVARGVVVVLAQMAVVATLLTVGWHAIVAAGGPEQPLAPQLLAWCLATSLSCKPVLTLLNHGRPAGRPALRLVLVGITAAAGATTSALPSLYPVIVAGASLITLPRSPGLRTEATAGAVVVTGSVAMVAGVQAGLVPTVLPGAAGTTVCGGLVLAALVFLRYAGVLATELAASRAALAREQHLRVQELHDASTHDPLTGLLNRAGLDERIGPAMAAAAPGRATGVLYLDLDAFKPVNDSYGHATGDALLVRVAERLQVAVRHGDCVARVGGDEFLVLLRDVTDEDDVRAVAERATAALLQPVVLPAATLTVGASLGWALTDDPRTGWEALVTEADRAMYEAKRCRPRRGAAAVPLSGGVPARG